MAINPLTQPIPPSLIQKLIPPKRMKLPIELVANTNPPKFRWWQTVNGSRIRHEGSVSPNMEVALMQLIIGCMKQAEEIVKLRKQIEGHIDRIAAQSELLSKQAEKPEPLPPTKMPAPIQPKKGK